jgi:tellurite resistance protein TerC
VSKFSLLKYALGSILVFVGLKMIWLNEALGGTFPISWSLAIIGVILATFLFFSLMPRSRKGIQAKLPKSVVVALLLPPGSR